MMRFNWFLLILMCFSGAAAQSTVTWLNKVHDFGAFDEDTKKKTAFFRFVNTTDQPVAIVSAAATCGCTVPKYDEAPVAPGDTATIEVSYDPSGRPGRFEKQVYVRTSEAFDRTKLLIKGVVIGNPETINGRYPVGMGPLKLRNGAAMFGKVLAGHEKVNYVDGYNLSTDSIRPVITDVPPYIDVRVTPEVVAPGEMMSIDFTFTGSNADMWGIVTDSVMIAPNPDTEAHAFPIVAIIEEDFSTLTPAQLQNAPDAQLSTQKLQLPDIPLNSTTPVTGTITLTNQGKDPLCIRRIYTEDSGLTIADDWKAASPIAAGKTCDISVTFDPTAQPTGVVNCRIIVITNDPAKPSQTVRIVASR